MRTQTKDRVYGNIDSFLLNPLPPVKLELDYCDNRVMIFVEKEKTNEYGTNQNDG